MQDIAPVIAFVGILVFLAHLFTGIFSRTRIPDVLLLIIIGICIGPVFGLVSTSQFGVAGPVMTTITLIIILFESGTALELSTLRSTVGGAMALANLSFFLTMGAVAGFALWLTDLELIPAFILGAIVSSISEAIVIPLIKQINPDKRRLGNGDYGTKRISRRRTGFNPLPAGNYRRRSDSECYQCSNSIQYIINLSSPFLYQ